MRSPRSILHPVSVAAGLVVLLLLGATPVVASAAPEAPAAPAAPAAPGAPAASTGSPLPDPGAEGPEPVDELSYDLGDQAYLPAGFPARVELKARVYAPRSIVGRAPLVVVQHGRHVTCANESTQRLVWPCPAAVPEVPSYLGYDDLGRNLASHGMVVVSIGANGINANDGFLADGGAAARADQILEHLRRWQVWSTDASASPFGSRFVGRVDLDRVGLMGHSRGGEGVAAAVQLNQRIGSPFGIEAAVLLAPVDFGRRVVGGVDLSVILPYCDGDVSDLQGANYYDDGRYGSPGDPTSKTSVLLHGANHNFFNTIWTTGPGSFDDAGFGWQTPGQPADPCSPEGSGRLSAADQSRAGAVLMAAHLRRYLQPEVGLARFVTGAAPYPASTGPARWSISHHAADRLDIETWSRPSSFRVNAAGQLARLRGVSSGVLCNASSNNGGFGPAVSPDVVRAPCPTFEDLAGTNDTGVLDVGWVRQGPVVRQAFGPEGVDVTGYDGLRMRVGVLDDHRNTTRAKQDFTIVLEDVDGVRSTALASAGTNGLHRLNPGVVRHVLLNGVRIPLTSFTGVDLERVGAVELRFDRTGAGRVSVADLAFTMEGTGSAMANRVGPVALTPPRAPCRRTAATRWACALANALWGRDPVGNEFASLAAGYSSPAGRRRAIAQAMNARSTTDVRLQRLVTTYTQSEVEFDWLDAVVSADGRRRWEIGTVQLIEGLAFSSPSLPSTEAVVRATYETIAARPADPIGLAYWVPRVEASGPARLVSSLLRTEAARTMVLEDRYLQILGRAPDPSGRAFWLRRLGAPGGEQALVASLLATESFRTWAVH